MSERQQPPAIAFRRSQALFALAFAIPGLVLAFMDFMSGNGLFWKLVQIVLIGVGGLIFWREGKRVRLATTSAEVSESAKKKPPST